MIENQIQKLLNELYLLREIAYSAVKVIHDLKVQNLDASTGEELCRLGISPYFFDELKKQLDKWSRNDF